MVGRAEELRFIADVIADPHRPGVLIAGPAGVGKTRLMHEVLDATDGCHIEWINASESLRPLPFGALAQLLPSNLHLVDPLDLLSVLGRHLQHRAAGQPVVLAVDDVHLLDGLTAGFIDYAANRGLATILLTLRSGSPVPDVLERLLRNGDLPRLELQAVSRSEFDQMLEQALDGIIEIASLNRMWEATRGNVLFARELIADVLEGGALRQNYGVWQWDGGVGSAPRLQEAVAARLEGLTDPQRRFVELLSIGEPLALATAERVSDDGVLLELERRGLIAVESNSSDRIRFSHPLFGEALRAEMPPLLRRHLNRQLAHILQDETHRSPADLVKLAVVWRDSGERVDPTILAEAAQIANRLSDHLLAEDLAADALAQHATFLAQFELGWSLMHQHRYVEASDLLQPLVGSEPDDTARERLADAIALTIGMGLGRVDDALSLMTDVEHSAGPKASVMMQAQRATLHAFHCQYDEAIALGRDAMRADDSDRVFVRSLPSVASSLVMIGQTEEALALTEAGLGAAMRVRNELPRALGWAISSRCTALTFSGRITDALELFELFAPSPGLPAEVRSLSNIYLARLFLFQGKAASAARSLQEVPLDLRTDPSYGRWGLALLAEAEALLGHRAAAEAARSESLSQQGTDRLAFFVDERRSLAWVHAQAGRLTDAVAELWTAADMARDRGQRCFELIILDDLLRLGEHHAAGRAQELSGHVQGSLGEAIGLHAGAVISGRGSDLESSALAFAAMSHALVASELWAAASVTYRREGLQARSTKAARKSHESAELCQGARVRPASVPDQVEPLSRRQREVALLAAQGATNVEVAHALSVSVRTVESHLYAVFAKLGLSAREELSAALTGTPE